MFSSSKTARGFTLIEAAIASFVLLVGILALAKIFPVIARTGKAASEKTIAANLIQSKIEEVFSLGYGNISVGVIEAKHRLGESEADPFYDFQRQTAVEYVDINLNPAGSEHEIKKITVTVYWFNPVLIAEENASASIVITER